jgi:putative resolvase
MNAEYIPAKEITYNYGVSRQTLRMWANNGKIRYKQTPGGKRFYSREHVRELFGEPPTKDINKDKHRYIYARVSSSHQKQDLERQIKSLQEEYPEHSIISDIGSGLNWKRKGLLNLLERVEEGNVEEVVVAHKDRLARFGCELIEWIFKTNSVRFVVQCRGDDFEELSELSDDLLAVTTFFVARQNGRRSASNRAKRKISEKEISGEVGEKEGNEEKSDA